MKTPVSRGLVALLLSFSAGVTGQAAAVTITVANPGFESQVLADGVAEFGVSGWTPSSLGVAGAWNPTTTQYPSEAPEGQNVAFVNGSGNFIVQDLDVFVTADLTYTLEVDVGKRLDLSGINWDYSVDLIIAGTTDASGILAQDFGTLSPNPGQFLTSTVTYTAPSTGTVIGKELAIRLRNWDSDQVNFDNVRLTAVPVPAALYLFGSGLLGFVGVSLRKRAV